MLTTQRTPRPGSRVGSAGHGLRTPLGLALSLVAMSVMLLTDTGTATAAPCSKGGDDKFGCGLGDGGGGSGGGGDGPSGGDGGGQLPEPSGDNGAGGNFNNDPDPLPTPQQLAETLRSSAVIPVPVVRTEPARKTYVRLRTTLAVDNYTTVATEPITSGGRTVQAVATPYYVKWNVGETTFDCYGSEPPSSPKCQHVYQRSSANAPGGAHQITATIFWRVDWTCAGATCGTGGGRLLDLQQTSTPLTMVVSEIQTNTRS
ncbi:hypothetical protein DFJ69_1429 [Thermomonospora umbrina]|uniref:Uncharacterized protein n=1 Tax=Thermomonospora umbrina TaxID=111806 RepID=A0A3D9SJE8_9ACTN|nr:hypothetical protein DFJ69_1429 [Thermomonospora umbrina]